jgi:hypothetical protein
MILEEGYLKGAVKGFNNRNTIFSFIGGGTWMQSEYKYLYQYQYQPYARVIETHGEARIQIEGINDTALVKRFRE